jgi:proteasome accessory factor C
MTVARYARRFSHVPHALFALLHHPGGLPLATLAAQVGVSEKELREELLTFFAADATGGTERLQRDVCLEFTTAEGDDDIDPADADVVRLLSPNPLGELGLQYLPAAEFGRLLRAALEVRALEPDNADLGAAIERLTASLLGGAEAAPPEGGEVAAVLREAARTSHRVRLRYTRTWHPGVVDRVIEPYRVLTTRRGFECDAGPLDEDGAIRSYLVTGISEVEVLDETFERPDDVADRLERARRAVTVSVVVPHRSSWVVEQLAERVRVVRSDDDDLQLEADVLPPVADRVGLMLVVAGPDAFVTDPAGLTAAGRDTARALLEHHGLTDRGRAADGPG